VGLGLWLPEQPVVEIPFVVAHINCNFKFPILLGQRVEVGTRAIKVGRSSIRLEHRVEADGKLAADGYCVLVFMDIKTGQSAAITPQMVTQIEAFEGRKVATNA
jgi:acyl-CoA thioester hydrolase